MNVGIVVAMVSMVALVASVEYESTRYESSYIHFEGSNERA